MKGFLLLAGLAALMHGPALAEDFGGLFRGKPAEYDDFGYLVRGAAWIFKPGDERVIFVCWENPTPANDEARGWVRDQITKTWQQHTALEFRGWQQCAERNAGIRIVFSDEGPHVNAFGRFLSPPDKGGIKNGMVLNDTFMSWGQPCQKMRESCIRSIAVHEFGHALGFAHEQNRPDTPGECRDRHGQGQTGDRPGQGLTKEKALTPYDPHSVMNYCNPEYGNKGVLSPLDIIAAQKLYGRPAS